PQFAGDDAQKQADLQVAHRRMEIEVATARSELTGLVPGMTFELSGHPLGELDGGWLVVAAHHQGSSAGGGGSGGQGEEGDINRLELIPAEVEYRPRRTLFKRRVDSVMTATVTRPEGEEIHTDVHGRVKVQFHWDRRRYGDERASCWVRSMQPWAGQGWGFL